MPKVMTKPKVFYSTFNRGAGGGHFTFLQQIYVKYVHLVYVSGIRTHDLQNMIVIPKAIDYGSDPPMIAITK